MTNDEFSDIIMLVDLRDAAMAQLVEHILGKDEVISSILISSLALLRFQEGFIFNLKNKNLSEN